MIDGEKGFASRQGDGLGAHDTDDDPADQAWPPRHGDAVEIIIADCGLIHGVRHQGVYMVKVGTRGDFRHHAAIGPMLLGLRQQRLAQNTALAVHHCGGGFIATGFYAENYHM